MQDKAHGLSLWQAPQWGPVPLWADAVSSESMAQPCSEGSAGALSFAHCGLLHVINVLFRIQRMYKEGNLCLN